MRKLIFLWIALVVVSLQALANDKESFTASAPDAVAEGCLLYTSDAADE